MIDWLKEILASQFGLSMLVMLLAVGGVMGAAAWLILFERKVAAWTQDRYGPNRVGPRGLFQPIADGLKLFLKEDIIPGKVDRALFIFAPCIALIIGMLGVAIVPFGGVMRWSDGGPLLKVQVASIDIGLLYVVAVGSLGVYSVVLGGWASNNKYATYGGMRAAAQMLSYEVPLGLCLLVCILSTGQLRLEGMVERQIQSCWLGILQPLVFVLFFTTALAEANRAPFDLAECEQELVGGFHTEYSAMKWALFFFGEYAHMVSTSAVMVALFLGGWEPIPFSLKIGGWLESVSPLAWLGAMLKWITLDPSPWAALVRGGVYVGKVGCLIFCYMWVRWTLPRFRFDQLMRLAWKAMVPTGMALAVWAGFLVYWGRPMSAWALAGNGILLLLCGMISVASGRPTTGRQDSLPKVEGVS
ncbi:MAG: NADH-quinone oxidoreductase subunit NuoH [Phycisphaerae bacterium]|nr:NADH-quinone oxidoreductase subunit NuoH [Phycisphaerae bacterium]NUQ44845.1 NADH-quinone oxidoreductase subunit NuoH [Phycisphaerae bacterium]